MEIEKSAESMGSSSPRKAARELQKQLSQKANCLCSPTTHAGSFRCRHHRSSLRRNSSSCSTVAELANKESSVDNNVNT
ncbi:hypothetical protein IEQ34_013730 [Dendrobium chrysotoxum]|uniref:Uncharacterized protein n=1 Tax=Dendrobium chrysotoxum TaxID=161865 RepID=A0AAV7G9N4_DENCH|nr:hypothetical protein IEQ34_013730 [Dendrobium chrysotoxum]